MFSLLLRPLLYSQPVLLVNSWAWAFVLSPEGGDLGFANKYPWMWGPGAAPASITHRRKFKEEITLAWSPS